MTKLSEVSYENKPKCVVQFRNADVNQAQTINIGSVNSPKRNNIE